MTRLHKIALALSLLIVASVSGAWVIKDTANPVDIYTGSNTTPTLRAASDGSVTVGVSAATTPAVTNTFQNGDGSNTNGTNSLVVKTGNQGAHAARLKLQNSTGASTDVYEMTVGSGIASFRNGTPTSIGAVDLSSGSWTLGPTGYTGAHAINGGASFTRAVTTGSTAGVGPGKISSVEFGPIANAATHTLTPIAGQTMIFAVNATDNYVAIFLVTEGASYEVFDSSGAWSTGFGTGLNNIYMSGSVPVLQNNSGGSKSYRIMAFGSNSLQ